jgi:uncharacterized delta-60 repeat protein
MLFNDLTRRLLDHLLAAGKRTGSARPALTQRKRPGFETLEPRLLFSAGTYLPAGNGLTVFPTEHYEAAVAGVNQQWATLTVPSLADSTAMQATPNLGNLIEISQIEDSPRLDYAIYFAEPGTYRVWVRAKALSGTDNSVHAGLNGVPSASAQTIDWPVGDWVWTNNARGVGPATLQIDTPGVHTVNLWMREDGAQIDQLLLTPDPDYIPSDEVLAESRRAKVVTGRLWLDLDRDGRLGDSEPGLPGVTVYADTNDNGTLDWFDLDQNGRWSFGEGEAWTVSTSDDPDTLDADESGDYVLVGAQSGLNLIRTLRPDRLNPLSPGIEADKSGIITVHSSVVFYDLEMNLLGQAPFDYPGSDFFRGARDSEVDADGNVWIYNGTFDPRLTRYNPAEGSIEHYAFPDWFTVNNENYGGIAIDGPYVFVSDMKTLSSGDFRETGFIRFDRRDGTWQRIHSYSTIDLAVGLDGLLYAGLANTSGRNFATVAVYDPVTLELVTNLQSVWGGGLTADEQGTIYTGFGPEIRSYLPDGTFDSSIPIDYIGAINAGALDMEISKDGRIVLRDYTGVVHITDPARTYATRLHGNARNVAWNPGLAGAAAAVPIGEDQTKAAADFGFTLPVFSPSLSPASDSGLDGDNATNHNNASPDSALSFMVSGLTAGDSTSLWAYDLDRPQQPPLLIGHSVVTDPGALLVTDGSTVLPDGGYRIAVEVENEQGAWSPTGRLRVEIDTRAGEAAVQPIQTQDTRPALTGTIDAADTQIGVAVDDGVFYPALNLGDGTWSLAAGVLPAITVGYHDVHLRMTDNAGNQRTITTADALAIAPDSATNYFISPAAVDEGRPFDITLATDLINAISFEIDWGDGTTQSVDASATQATHAYGDGSSTQTIVVTLKTTNGDFELTPGETGPAGTLDLFVRHDLSEPDGSESYHQVLALPDNSLLALRYLRSGSFWLTKVRPDGTIDTAFGNQGSVNLPYNQLWSLNRMPDGRIVVGGQTQVLMFNADGSLDTGFGHNGEIDVEARDIAIDEAGRIVAVSQFRVMRFLPNGQPDLSFGSNGVTTITPHANTGMGPMAVDFGPGGEVYVGLRIGDYPVVYKFDASGNPDLRFGDNQAGYVQFANPDPLIRDLAVDALGRILLAGAYRQTNGGYTSFVHCALPDGSVDTSFGTAGRVVINSPGNSDRAEELWVEPDGTFLVAGDFRSSSSTANPDLDFWLVKFNTDGTPDATFGRDGEAHLNPGWEFFFVYDVTRLADGRYVLPGYSNAAVGERSQAALAFVHGDPPDGPWVRNLPPQAQPQLGPSTDPDAVARLELVQANDPSPIDSAAGFTYSFDFDADGVFEIAGATDPVADVPKSFNTSYRDGYNVIAQITDKDGASTAYTVNISALPGDTDNDHDVDDADLGVAFSNYTGPVGITGGMTKAQGDTDGDGDIDDGDLGLIFASYTGPALPPRPRFATVDTIRDEDADDTDTDLGVASTNTVAALERFTSLRSGFVPSMLEEPAYV